MTPQEALNRLDETFIGDLELKIVLTKVLEKQIPKKPLEKTLEYNGYYGECPCCNRTVGDFHDSKQCYNCGQLLDWR